MMFKKFVVGLDLEKVRKVGGGLACGRLVEISEVLAAKFVQRLLVNPNLNSLAFFNSSQSTS